ncbi:choice-of-anchor K domain-containing protein [Kibdelosporangium phytohabitans]|uniref:Uncharacterized protein n=1 Tax=Kibdelosporangium phytohabitans TaxID=860235 RepID=A0A0N7F5D9_9PSEU|nr:choice-of-anchor K domain-containing protein [Kibdelosporangium phytohabitans]ALG13959.1 hypothetical protein AOZ06_50150 [Kibdelosporangium phytohabitans]MBE1467097.1 hypothetical protein [Kibdelosporangium phytohabitans]
MGRVLTNGTWLRVEPAEVALFSGLGTSDIKWGDVPYDQKSGYSFEGHLTDLKLDGTDFLLGTFTHHNNVIPIGKDWQFALYLTIILNFDDGNLQHPLPQLRFHHDETLNQGPQPEDIVDLPKIDDFDLIYVDNVEYRMSISGFWWNKRKVTQFTSPENSSNSAGVFATIKPTGRQGG